MKLVVSIISFLILPGWLFAGDVDNSLEMTFYSGFSFAEDKLVYRPPWPIIPCTDCDAMSYELSLSIDNSVLFGMAAGYYLNKVFEIEGNFSIAPTHEIRRASNIPLPIPFDQEVNVIAYNYDVNLVYNLEWKGIRPYFTAGIGGITRDSLSVESDFTYNFGAGSKFYFKKIGFRVEVNDHIIPDYFEIENKKHDVQFQSGIFFRLF